MFYDEITIDNIIDQLAGIHEEIELYQLNYLRDSVSIKELTEKVKEISDCFDDNYEKEEFITNFNNILERELV